jgi:hypothetical protein
MGSSDHVRISASVDRLCLRFYHKVVTQDRKYTRIVKMRRGYCLEHTNVIRTLYLNMMKQCNFHVRQSTFG